MNIARVEDEASSSTDNDPKDVSSAEIINL